MPQYPLCSEGVGRIDALREIVWQFLGEDAQVELRNTSPEKSEYDFYLQYDGKLSGDDLAKIKQLCRLKSNDKFYTESLKSDKGHSLSSGSNTAGINGTTETAQLGRPNVQPSSRPDTLLVKNIPRDLEPEKLETKIKQLFGAIPTIHSLAPYSSSHSCATVTFPKKEPEFPTRIIEDPYSSQRTGSTPKQLDFQYDTKFIGLTPLYDAGEKAEVDIIVVPGLGTHAFGTFRAPEGDQMWLRDFLKDDIPNIRVLLYGYESTVANSKSIQRVQDLAVMCLNIIHLFRDETETQDRPIIFLGQSLGGLIVQELLITAELNPYAPEYQIFNKWYGLVGFGIPTNGLNNSTLKKIVEGRANATLIQQISIDSDGLPSPYLDALAQNFQRISRYKSCKIIYFYETERTVPKRKIPGQATEVLMVKGERSTLANVEYLPIPKDHSEMVKYKNSADPTYRYVRDNLKPMVRRAAEGAGGAGAELGKRMRWLDALPLRDPGVLMDKLRWGKEHWD